jgi:hypothetical protein
MEHSRVLLILFIVFLPFYKIFLIYGAFHELFFQCVPASKALELCGLTLFPSKIPRF